MNLIKRWLLTLMAVCMALGAHAAETKVEQHMLGSGDVIRISVYQNADLSLETRVSELGQINFPLIGTVKVGGLTLPGAEAQIAKQLRDGNFVLKPQVNVMLMQVRSSQISVLGQISKPGRYPIETVNSKLSEMIAAAGGVVGGGADVVTLIGTRDSKPIKMEVDLPAILQAGRVDLDVAVANGDILYVDRAPMFYIYGEVQRPGVVRLERGMTVLQALALSGGVTQRGTERGLRVHRRDASGAVQVIEPKMNDPVLRDDVIYVRESVF
jgi:polysaccharide export outer membrane protein